MATVMTTVKGMVVVLVMTMVKGTVVALVMTTMVVITSYDQAAVGQRSQLCEY